MPQPAGHVSHHIATMSATAATEMATAMTLKLIGETPAMWCAVSRSCSPRARRSAAITKKIPTRMNKVAIAFATQVGSTGLNNALKPRPMPIQAVAVRAHPLNVRSFASKVRSSARSVRSSAKSVRTDFSSCPMPSSWEKSEPSANGF